MPWWSICKSKPKRASAPPQRRELRDVVDLVRVLLEDTDPKARRAAASALVEQAQTGSTDAAAAVDALLLGLDAPEIATSAPAAEALGVVGDARAIEPMVRRLLKCAPGSALHIQIASALANLVAPGDPRVVHLLRLPANGDPAAARLTLPLVAAVGEFGCADVLEALIAFAHHRSGDDDEVSFEDGHPSYFSASLLAIQALERILERDAEHASTEALRAVLGLQGLTYQAYPHSEHDRYREIQNEIDCSKVHRLARQELTRRGLTA